MRTITMIVRIAKPSMRYALTTCFVHAFGSSLGAPRPSFSKTSHFDGVTAGAGAEPCANTGAGTGAGAGLGATTGGATIGGAWTTAAGGGAATIAGAGGCT